MSYYRQCIWQETICLKSHSEGDWANEFALCYMAENIRFMLKGYGWRHGNPGDDTDDTPIKQFGKYKCYYRKQGDSTWILFANVKSGRIGDNNDDEDVIYEDVSVTTGQLPRDYYEVRIEAKDGPKHEAWGGWIENIVKNGIFYYDIKYRCFRPLKVKAGDSVAATDWSYGGKEIIDLDVVEIASIEDAVDEITRNYEIVAVDIDVVNIQEVVEFLTVMYRQIFDVVYVTESVAFFFAEIALWSPVDNVSIAEDIELFFDLLRVTDRYDNITVVEDLFIARSIIDLIAYEDISVVEWDYIETINVLQPNVYDTAGIIVEAAGFVIFNVLSPDVNDWAIINEWINVVRDPTLIPLQYEIIATTDWLIDIAVSPIFEVEDNVSIVEDIAYELVDDLQPDISDTIVAVEDVTLSIYSLMLDLTGFDDVGISEDLETLGLSYIAVYEDMTTTVDEFVALTIDIVIDVFDSVGIIDVGTIHDIVIEMSAVDNVSVAENLEADIPDIARFVYDEASVVEDTGLAFTELNLLVYDEIEATEWALVNDKLFAIDNIGIDENVSIELPFLPVDAFEVIPVEDFMYNLDPLRLMDSKVVFLAHFEGSDGTQYAPEESRWRQVYSFVNDTDKLELDTSQKQFGAASLLCPGHNGNTPYLKYTAHRGYDLGLNDFFIEFWFRYASDWPDNHTATVLHCSGGTGGWEIKMYHDTSPHQIVVGIYFLDDSTHVEFSDGWGGPHHFQPDTWYCLGLMRKDHMWRWFHDGKLPPWIQAGGYPNVVAWSGTPVYYYKDLGSGNDLYVGSHPSIANRTFDGWLDEILIVNGDPVYGSYDLMEINGSQSKVYDVKTEAYGEVAMLRPTVFEVNVEEWFDFTITGEREIFAIERIDVEDRPEYYVFPTNLIVDDDISITEDFNILLPELNVAESEDISIAEFAVYNDYFIEVGEDIGTDDTFFDYSQDMVVAWAMNDNAANSTITDSEGVHNAKLYKRSTMAEVNTSGYSITGKINKAIDMNAQDYFNGVGVELADNNDFTFGNGSTDSPFSIIAWVNFETHYQDQIIIAKWGSGGQEWSLSVYSGREVYFYMSDGTTPAYNCRIHHNWGAYDLPTGWQMVVITYDGSGSATGLNMYIGNTLQTLVTRFTSGSYVAMNNKTSPVTVGWRRKSSDNSWEYGWKGAMDMVYVWSKVIDTDTIDWFWSQGNGTEMYKAGSKVEIEPNDIDVNNLVTIVEDITGAII